MHWAPWELFDAATFGTYLGAAAALVAAPGPGQALVMARTLQGGVRAGLLTSVGLNLGTLAHTVAAALGLSALLLASATAFTVVKLAGAVYLIVLGTRMIAGTLGARPVAVPDRATEGTPRVQRSRLLAHGALTGVLNPKVAVFFLAFLPQFVRPERGGVFLQFAVLGGVLATLGVIGDALVAVLAARTGRRLAAGAWRERITGGVLVALGLRLALVRR
ncbi:MAG TPA: LysE family translocator [Myxococcaceae bacterium]|nr:LysE family translocator [Myxococcaceae bacterium]